MGAQRTFENLTSSIWTARVAATTAVVTEGVHVADYVADNSSLLELGGRSTMPLIILLGAYRISQRYREKSQIHTIQASRNETTARITIQPPLPEELSDLPLYATYPPEAETGRWGTEESDKPFTAIEFPLHDVEHENRDSVVCEAATSICELLGGRGRDAQFTPSVSFDANIPEYWA